MSSCEDLFGCRALLEQGFRCLAERVGEQLSVLRECLVEYADRLVLKLGRLLYEKAPEACQFAELLDVRIGHLGRLGVRKAQVLGDEHAVDGVGFRFAERVDFAECVGLDRVDDHDLVAVGVEELPERDPVVAGRLHSDETLIRLDAGSLEFFGDLGKARFVVAGAERLEDDVAKLIDGGYLMILFAMSIPT